ncbi:hypothetical protein PACTADRAFT_32331 [Pachysolen tannophilus NRRL Y-2460]|uniref:Potassium transporter n=1 Tax=Pachysolen tannophilus NRRL Y-2460 TaxID=669874 RepID=A0A1E4TYJ9_PACTA|nr:hypothetical protein PACTADRAFT_32331 [Pachysolen tannophilus NRRL Y-2460]
MEEPVRQIPSPMLEDVEANAKVEHHKRSILNSDKRDGWINVAILGFSSLGSIYGDIGTSPLYVFSSIFPENEPSQEDVYGAASCPNNNEGGQVAIYAKIARKLKIGPRGVKIPGEPEADDLLVITRSETHDSVVKSLTNRGHYHELFINKFLSKFIMGICFFGCGLVISDGLLTPTTSVLSAIDGISVAVPSFTTNDVEAVSCVIIFLLFSVQNFGSAKISFIFAPIIFIWMAILFVTGIISVSKHPEIFKSLSPKYAIDILKREKGIDILGAVMLAVTGTEAMFADIGHFSRLSIQLTLGFVVYPCLMLAYLGEASFLLDHPDAISNVFYLSLPGGTSGGFYWFTFVIATLAAIIASQALILGVFSIVSQMIHIDCFPSFKILHVSSTNYGRIYLPVMNYILMIAVICTCVGFKTSDNVTSAYGLGIALDFFLTTTLITICMIYVYRLPFFVPLFFFIFFGSLDMCLIVAGMKKVPTGAWFTLMMSALIFIFITYWRWCRSLKINEEYNARVRIRDIFDNLKRPRLTTVRIGGEHLDHGENESIITERKSIEPESSPKLVVNLGDGVKVDVTRYSGVGIMYTNVMHTLNSPNTVPQLFKHLVSSFPALPETFIFLGVRIASYPYVSEEERVVVEPMRTLPGFYRCVLRFGFMDTVKVDNILIAEIIFRIRDRLIDEEETDERIEDLLNPDGSLAFNVVHIFEKEIILSKKFDGMLEGRSNFYKAPAKIVIFFRYVLVEQLFSFLTGLFQSEDLLAVDESSQRVLFMGNRVEI